jgi:hypothetical protein
MYSAQCPGLVVTASGVSAQLTLQSAIGASDNAKWNFLSDGSIESVKTGYIEVFGSNIELSLSSSTLSESPELDMDIGAVIAPGNTVKTYTGDITVTGSGWGKSQCPCHAI